MKNIMSPKTVTMRPSNTARMISLVGRAWSSMISNIASLTPTPAGAPGVNKPMSQAITNAPAKDVMPKSFV